MIWTQHLADYLIFLLEVVTIVVAILLVVSGIIAAASKGKLKESGKLAIRPLHTHYKEIKRQLEHEIYTRSDLKREIKEEKRIIKQERKKAKKDNIHPKRIFVLTFDGDMRASQVESLREEVTAVLRVAKPSDEIVLKLESGGGVVHGYGLAASQLERIKQSHVPLTITVDKVAASGGYMMAVIADKLIAAPFAIIGSIGVIAQLPNFNRFLEGKGIDVELHTAGKFKRTLTTLGKNTDEGRQKFKEELEEVHHLFKDHIIKYRENLDLDKVATGEYWFGHDAHKLELVDELMTSDDYLLFAYEKENCELYEVQYKIKKGRFHKLQTAVEKSLVRVGL
jgi:serine protease SohB